MVKTVQEKLSRENATCDSSFGRYSRQSASGWRISSGNFLLPKIKSFSFSSSKKKPYLVFLLSCSIVFDEEIFNFFHIHFYLPDSFLDFPIVEFFRSFHNLCLCFYRTHSQRRHSPCAESGREDCRSCRYHYRP